jgi:hypothetical protein
MQTPALFFRRTGCGCGSRVARDMMPAPLKQCLAYAGKGASAETARHAQHVRDSHAQHTDTQTHDLQSHTLSALSHLPRPSRRASLILFGSVGCWRAGER